jgi:hypothetical protein
LTDFGSMTLSEIEALAKRLEEAARVFREARELLGGAAVASQPAQQHVTPVAVAPPTRTRTPLSAADVADMKAQRDALVARNRDELPEDIKRLEVG